MFMSSIVCGCLTSSKKTRLDVLFENNFKNFQLPEKVTIKRVGEQRFFPQTTYDEIWDAIDDSDDTFSSSSKTIRCPYCGKFVEAFLDIDILEISDEEDDEYEKDV